VGHATAFSMKTALEKFNEKWAGKDEQLKIFVFKGKDGNLIRSELVALDSENNARFIPTNGFSDLQLFAEEILMLEEA
jgi:hypothetical protein